MSEEKRLKVLARAKAWYQINKERKKAYDRKYLAAKREYATAKRLEWNSRNIEKRREINRRYYEANKKAVFSNMALRRARLKNACPSWLSEDHMLDIKKIYANRPDGFHVDHIVPLAGKNVCGLHVPWNLQYLPAAENFKKGAKNVA